MSSALRAVAAAVALVSATCAPHVVAHHHAHRDCWLRPHATCIRFIDCREVFPLQRCPWNYKKLPHA